MSMIPNELAARITTAMAMITPITIGKGFIDPSFYAGIRRCDKAM